MPNFASKFGVDFAGGRYDKKSKIKKKDGCDSQLSSNKNSKPNTAKKQKPERATAALV
jgi:hypothetical protein